MAGFVFTNANVVTGRGEIVRSGHVVVEDGRIANVAPGPAPSRPAREFRVIDAADGWLIPGFIDAHVHLCYEHRGDSSATDRDALRAGAANARAKLLTGVTTVRDVGAFHQLNLELRARIQAGELVGPRMLTSGDFLSAPGGHCFYWARQASGPADVIEGVREQLQAGADLIKLMASAGVADAGEDPTVQQLDSDELSAAVQESSRWGAPVAVHAHPEEAIRAAVLAGCSTIEHGTYLSRSLVELMIDRGVAVIPTLAVYHRIASGADGDDKGTSVLAQSVLDEKLPRLRDAVAQGVTIGVGTDSGSNFPADDFATELELLCDLGISPHDAIVAATAGNAAILRIDDRTGAIEAGLSADMVLLRENPMDDISNCRDVRSVVSAGQIHSPAPSDLRLVNQEETHE